MPKGIYIRSNEIKEMMRKRMTGNKQSKETIAKRTETRKWYKHSEKSKEKMRSIALERKKLNGFINSSETREKIRISLLGNKNALGHKMSKTGSNLISEYNRKFRTGSNNHFWKGGITPEYNKQRNSIEARLWREAVFSRDHWTCQKCKDKTGGNLNAHHIQNFSSCAELRFTINNGITFCKNCHKKFHNLYGKGNNTREQLSFYLKRTS